LQFRWLECDGPTVSVPTRRGFGSVIIERMVPFDLQGTASIQYLPAGLEANFHIPERHIAPRPAPHHDAGQTLAADLTMRVAAPLRVLPLEGLHVLLLEDNLVVALETEDVLRSLGAASVYTASTIAGAAALLEAQVVQFAVLDINLGVETSLDFGVRLRTARIPFIFASGYGENISVGPPGQPVLTVTKPYDRDQLAQAIGTTLYGTSIKPLS
jgi:CheY-like chemotaxis protein